MPEYGPEYYFKPWTRAPPYLVGIFLGWLLHEMRNSTVKISKPLVVCGWTLAIGMGLSIVYGLVPYLHQEVDMPTAVDMSYGPLHRFVWAIALAWLIFACLKGYGGWYRQ